jgi:hypothetical protein
VSVYHLQSNGVVERANDKIFSAIKKKNAKDLLDGVRVQALDALNKYQVLGRRRTRHPSLNDFVLALHRRRLDPQNPPGQAKGANRMEACSTPFAHTRQDKGPAEVYGTSHSITTKRDPGAVRPIELGPSWACAIRVVSVIKFTVIIVCNLPSC